MRFHFRELSIDILPTRPHNFPYLLSYLDIYMQPSLYHALFSGRLRKKTSEYEVGSTYAITTLHGIYVQIVTRTSFPLVIIASLRGAAWLARAALECTIYSYRVAFFPNA